MGKLTAGQVADIRRKWAEGTMKSMDKLGDRYNVSVSTIGSILKGRTWKEGAAGPRLDHTSKIKKGSENLGD
jgi:hypothetical protein